MTTWLKLIKNNKVTNSLYMQKNNICHTTYIRYSYVSRQGIMDKQSKKKRVDSVFTVVEWVVVLVNSWVRLEAYSNGEILS